MKFAVRYASRGGNTRAVADVIAKKAGVTAKRVSEPLNEEVDVLFVGGGVWFANVTKDMKEFLNTLDKSKVKEVVAFSTSGHLDSAIKKIQAAAQTKGIKVSNHAIDLHMNMQGFSLFSQAGGDLTEAQTAEVEKFADEVLSEA
ncbi:flavodoxin family protein [Lactococcus nasutitermitis]|uniref:Flavodoxin family protein n=1 Tax=Lactococcus nasutitermitis TaxID=1652957 RepID=A0ABV9JDJ1_9LACT|nr:flavodoxin family protein [Lactococcus nasutitermitis]